MNGSQKAEDRFKGWVADILEERQFRRETSGHCCFGLDGLLRLRRRRPSGGGEDGARLVARRRDHGDVGVCDLVLELPIET